MTIRPYIRPRDGKKGWMADVSRQVRGRQTRCKQVVWGSKAKAVAVESKMREEMIDRVQLGIATPHNASFQALVDEYLKYSKLAKRSHITDIQRSRALLRHFGEMGAGRISHDDVVRYVTGRRKQTSARKTAVSPATVDRELALLKAIYNHAIRNRAIVPPYNPAQYVRLARAPNRRERIVSDEEFTHILGLISPFHRAIFMAGRYTGLRRGAILQLEWGQIEGGLIRPPGFDPSNLYESSKRHGIAPAPAGLIQLFENKKKKGFVFTRKGLPLKAIRNTMERARKVSGVDFWFHDLRRTFTNQLRTLGVEELVRKTITGHAAGSVHERYLVVSDKEILAVKSQIESLESYKEHLEIAKDLSLCWTQYQSQSI